MSNLRSPLVVEASSGVAESAARDAGCPADGAARDRQREERVAEIGEGSWPKRVAGASNANATVAERDSDMDGGVVFHDNRVEVECLARDTGVRYDPRAEDITQGTSR